MSQSSTVRAPPPWRWSLVLTGVGLLIWASAEYRSGLYAIRTGGDLLDTIGRVAFSCGAGLGVFVGAIITVWLFTGGVRQRRQAWFALAVTLASLFVACWNLSAAIALPQEVREAHAFRASVVYQEALKTRRDAQLTLAMPYVAPQDVIALKEKIAETDPVMAKGEDPIIGTASWLDWMLALGQHLLGAGFGAAFRVPIPERKPKKARAAKAASEPKGRLRAV